MKDAPETDDSLVSVILRVVDSMVTVGIMALVIGIVLLTLFPPGSFGATSALDLGAAASATMASRQVYGPELPAREGDRREPSNLDLGKKDAPRMPSRLEKFAGNAGHGSQNVIRTDETSVRLIAPWH